MRRSINFILALVLVAACSKETPAPQGDEPSGGEQSGGETTPEIETIEMPSTLVMDIDWSGLMLDVTLTPSNASYSELKITVEDESVVSATQEGNGFMIKPKKVGSTKLHVGPTRGGASIQTCTVTVNEKGITQAVEVTQCELLSSDSADKREIQDYADAYREAYFKVKLTPSTAKLSDDMVWTASKPDWVESLTVDSKSYGNGVYGFKVKVKKNTSQRSDRVGSMSINFVPKKGSGKLSVPLNVRGHIYQVVFTVLSSTGSNNVVDGEVHLSAGESLTITPTISKTGTLLSSDELQFSVSGSYGLSVDSNYKLKLSTSPSSYSTTSGVDLVCSDKTGALTPVNIKVHTYATPTGISISKVYDGKSAYLYGDKVTFNVAVSPTTARQQWTVGSGWYNVFSQSSSQLVIQWTHNGRVDPLPVVVSTRDGKYSKTIELYVDNFKATDVKEGDYVVYNTSTKKFRLVDGGVRAITGSSTTYRGSIYGPGTLGSTEKIIGLVINDVKSADASKLQSKYGVTLQGFTNSSEHAAIVSTTDAKSWVWSSDSDSEDKINGVWKNDMGGKYGSSPCLPSNFTYVVSAYEATMGWRAYNDIRGASHRVKAVYAADDYKTPCDLSGTGTTGWILPTCYYDTRQVKILNERLVKVGGAEKLSGSYWTACYYDASQAYYQDITNCDIGKEKKNSEKAGRPVLYL